MKSKHKFSAILTFLILNTFILTSCTRYEIGNKQSPANIFLTNLVNMYNGGQCFQCEAGVFYSQQNQKIQTLYWAPGGDLSKIVRIGNTPIRCLAVADNKVYYTDTYMTSLFGGGNQSLYCADFSLSNPIKLADENCVEAFLYKDALFFTTETGLSKISLDGIGVETIFNENVSNLFVYDGCLYFCLTYPSNIYEQTGIYRISLDPPNYAVQDVLTFGEFEYKPLKFYIVNNKIYYLADHREVYSYDIDSHETVGILVETPNSTPLIMEDSFFIYNDELIISLVIPPYVNEVRAYNINTGKTRQVLNKHISGFSVINGGIVVDLGDGTLEYTSIDDPAIKKTIILP